MELNLGRLQAFLIVQVLFSIFIRIGMDLPRTALDQAHLGKRVDPKKEELQIGELYFIRWIGPL